MHVYWCTTSRHLGTRPENVSRAGECVPVQYEPTVRNQQSGDAPYLVVSDEVLALLRSPAVTAPDPPQPGRQDILATKETVENSTALI